MTNLRLLWWLRNVAILGQAAAIIVATEILHIKLNTGPLWLIISALAMVNILTLWRVKIPVTQVEFLAQLLVDITALFGLLYFSGGAANPFTSLFILQVIIAAITLTSVYTWIAATAAVGFYTLLMFFYVPITHLEHNHDNGFSLHVEGMWISFVLLAVIVAWFVVRMNNIIRRQNALLAEADKLAAIGTLAANAAHELGTPLNTLTILAEGQGAVFKEQLARCKQIVSRITQAGGVMRAESGAAIKLEAFFLEIVEEWKKDHADTKLVADISGGDLNIISEYNLQQAIRNLLDNAADASPDEIKMIAKWTPQTLTLTIRDYGKGMPDGAGEIGVTTKEDGMGLGLFLARSVIARLDGKLELKYKSGTHVIVTLPLKRIAI